MLLDPFQGANYVLSLVGVDAKVVAGSQVSLPGVVRCGQQLGSVPVPVSTSNRAAYYMDASGAVRWISPVAKSGDPVITLPAGPSTRSVFAVAPDDSQIAVAVIDFASGGTTTRLFVDDLTAGGAHKLIFTETGLSTLWPIGWHGGDLVVAKVTACTDGNGPACCQQQELHVVNAATAARKYTIGGPTCVIAGPPSAGGAVCENSGFTQANEVNWTGGTFKSREITGPTEALISPDSQSLAMVTNNDTNLSYTIIIGVQSCEWIDSSHLLSGGDAQSQPKVAVPNGKITPVSATGYCAGRIPGAL